MKQVWINQLHPGQDINECFVLRKLEIKEYSGSKFLNLEFGDKTGRIGGVCWENADELFKTFSTGNIVSVRGIVVLYKDIPQIKVAFLDHVKDDSFDPLDFLPSGPREPEKMITEIDEIIDTINDSDYKNLLSLIFNDEKFRRIFMYAPAAKLWHHAYIGGLTEHTLNVASLCRAACEIYENINSDLLIAGALLHDIGKAETYSLNNYFDYTDEGRLIGHIVIADRIISETITQINKFPVEKQKLIRHLALSHHGTYEQGSPVLPQTMESNILHIVDLLDSRVGGIQKVQSKARFPGQRWSNYVNLLDRFIYFGEKPGEE